MDTIFEKKFEITELFDTYGDLLTARQTEVMEMYLDEDLNLVEIAENDGVSKQAIFDNINKSKLKLKSFEDKMMIIQKKYSNERDINRIINKLNEIISNYELELEEKKMLSCCDEIKYCIEMLKKLSY